MSQDRPARLPSGAYRHPTCPQCETRSVKNLITEDVRWTVRSRYCDDGLVDFSVLLEVREAVGWQQVTRYSVAHANFHQYLPSRRGRRHRHEFGTIDSQADVDRAYTVALHEGMDQTEYWLEEWRRFP